jgi:hypothetical protein
MVISVKETTVFSVFHPDAQDLFNTCSDLKKVAWELWDPNRRLNDEVWARAGKASQTPGQLKIYVRINKYTFSAPSLPCFAKDQLRRLKIPSRKWVEAISSSRRNLTGNVCNCTSEAMNTSIVLGRSCIFPCVFKYPLTSRILQERQRLYIPIR